MRGRPTFTTADLTTIVQQCWTAGVKAYLTLNTVLYDHDMQWMRTIMDEAKHSGIDAIIVSDHAAMAYGPLFGSWTKLKTVWVCSLSLSPSPLFL